MNQFQNRTVRITLTDSSRLQGTVTSVANGQLTLSNVHLLDSGVVVPSFMLTGSYIKDLEILAAAQQRSPTHKVPNHVQGMLTMAPPPDPAIVSASPATLPAQTSQTPVTSISVNISNDDSSEESDVETTPYSARKETLVKRTPNGSRTPRTPRTAAAGGANKNLWAHENLNAITNTDFDFEANLQRFDKSLVFEEIRHADQTDPKNRLVSHNRVQPKYGNKEMVLETDGSSIADSTAPKTTTTTTSSTATSTDASRRPSQAVDSHFVTNNLRKCPCASPLQLVELHRSLAQYGLTEAATNENAARGVAQLCIQTLGGTTRFTLTNHNARPLVIVLAGHNVSGARALAAGRILANRGVEVLALVLGSSNTDSAVSEQVKSLKASDGKVFDRPPQISNAVAKFSSPVELIIDGLQGYENSLEDLWGQENQVKQIVKWANGLRAKIIAIDVPSGIDASTGRVSSLGALNAKFILSGGLPLTGLLNRTDVVEGLGYYLVDIGIPKAAFRSPSFRKFEQIWFGSEWLIELGISPG